MRKPLNGIYIRRKQLTFDQRRKAKPTCFRHGHFFKVVNFLCFKLQVPQFQAHFRHLSRVLKINSTEQITAWKSNCVDKDTKIPNLGKKYESSDKVTMESSHFLTPKRFYEFQIKCQRLAAHLFGLKIPHPSLPPPPLCRSDKFNTTTVLAL